MKYIFLIFAVLFNVSAYIIFKSLSGKANDLQWFVIFSVGLLFGAINTFLFTKSLKEINLGIAYPVFSAASISLIILISVFVFNEKVTFINIVGFLVILIGIILLTR